MDRRGFLKSILAIGAAPAIVRAGSLMPVVQTASGLLLPAAAVILWGDGVQDDRPGLQALLNGERVVRQDGSQVTSLLIGGTYLVGSTINVNASSRQGVITHAHFIAGHSLGDHPIMCFHNNAPDVYATPTIENCSFIDRRTYQPSQETNAGYSAPAKKISQLLDSMLGRITV